MYSPTHFFKNDYKYFFRLKPVKIFFQLTLTKFYSLRLFLLILATIIYADINLVIFTILLVEVFSFDYSIDVGYNFFLN